MALASWIDAGLPACFIFGSAAEERDTGNVEDPSNEVGASRTRARVSRTLRRWPQVETPPLVRTMLEAVETFHDDTLVRGARAFEFPRPRRRSSDDAVVIVDVKFISAISIVPYAGGKYIVRFGVREI